MSEFQYYEFQSIDKPLSDEDKRVIGTWSSRTIPSSRKAIFTYSYGDFPRDEKSVLLEYFDAFFYIANWGTKKLMFRLPKALVDFKALKQYEIDASDDFENGMKIHEEGSFVVVEIFSTEEGGGWLSEEQPWLDDLISLRREILQKDYRSLFLIWLHGTSINYEYEPKPNVAISQDFIPNNLKELSSGLDTLVELFEIDNKLIEKISNHSLTIKKNLNAEKKKISLLPDSVKDKILRKLLEEDSVLANQLNQELRKMYKKTEKKTEKKKKTTKKKILLKSVFGK